MPPGTLRTWAARYVVKGGEGRAEPPSAGRARVPFIGVAEACTLLAFEAAGGHPVVQCVQPERGLRAAAPVVGDLAQLPRRLLPVQRIRPAIRALATVFALANTNVTAVAAAACRLEHEVGIRAIAAREPGPYVIAVSRDRLRRCRLNAG